jgi:hypothetical protein
MLFVENSLKEKKSSSIFFLSIRIQRLQNRIKSEYQVFTFDPHQLCNIKKIFSKKYPTHVQPFPFLSFVCTRFVKLLAYKNLEPILLLLLLPRYLRLSDLNETMIELLPYNHVCRNFNKTISYPRSFVLKVLLG